MTLIGGPALLAGLAAISIVAGTAKGLTGFGGALVMAPLFGCLVEPSDAAVLIIVIHGATGLQGLREWGKSVRWRAVAPLAVVALAIATWTAHLFAQGPPMSLRRSIALVVLAMTLLHTCGWKWRHQGRWPSTLVAGLVSGVLTTLAGLGGPPAVYYFSGISAGSALRANLLAYFALLFAGATVLMLATGRLHSANVATAAVLVPAFMSGVKLGEHGHGLLPSAWFDRAVTGLLVMAGITALLV